MRLPRPASSFFFALSLAACGAQMPPGDRTTVEAGSGGGEESGPVVVEDAGSGCTSDADCSTGQVCVRSTGECVLAETAPPVADPDAGPLASCSEGEVASCGSSKIGECRLGVATCSGGVFGPCIGAVDPAPDVCNGGDDDCDGLIDEDLPIVSCGRGACLRMQPSCVDGAPVPCVPGAPSAETCNGADDDCDGMIDDGLMSLSCGTGACARTVAACVMGQEQACIPGLPSAEQCNGVDDDCNGMSDEGLGSTTCGQGICMRTVANCSGGVPRTCTPGAAMTEVCNGADDDCDGQTDEGLGNRTCGLGACARSVPACTGGVPGVCTPGTAGVETCNGVDDDCDGTVDDGVCGPAAMCPAGSTVSPNTTVALPTMASAPSGRAITCRWSVVSRPASSSGTFSAPNSCASSNYFADVVGTHTLRFTVTDSTGLSTSCTVDVVVNPVGGLWLELTWSHNNDMDLHLQHPSAGNSHTQNGWSLNASPYDCFYLQTNPSWDAAGTADDPSLDRDDITGKGPENIRINTPATSHDYVIGVHMYSWAASPSTVTATLKVYCGGVLKTTQSRGFSSVDDMWVVGKVRFGTSGTCTFTPDGYVFNLP